MTPIFSQCTSFLNNDLKMIIYEAIPTIVCLSGMLPFLSCCLGSTFEYFAPISLRNYEPCVAYNHQLSHQWTEMNCQVKNGYICDEGLYFFSSN